MSFYSRIYAVSNIQPFEKTFGGTELEDGVK